MPHQQTTWIGSHKTTSFPKWQRHAAGRRISPAATAPNAFAPPRRRRVFFGCSVFGRNLAGPLIGGALGLFFAIWARDALIAFAPGGAPRFEQIGFDFRVLGFTLLLAGLTTILFGLWPAWLVAHADIQTALQAGAFGSSETRTARRSRDWLVVAEVALTLLLLSAAGLVLKSLNNMQSVALGYQPRGLLTVRIDLPYTKYSDSQKTMNFVNGLLDEVRRLPGVNSAAIGSNPPMLSGWQINFLPEGAPPTDRVSNQQPIPKSWPAIISKRCNRL